MTALPTPRTSARASARYFARLMRAFMGFLYREFDETGLESISIPFLNPLIGAKRILA